MYTGFRRESGETRTVSDPENQGDNRLTGQMAFRLLSRYLLFPFVSCCFLLLILFIAIEKRCDFFPLRHGTDRAFFRSYDGSSRICKCQHFS